MEAHAERLVFAATHVPGFTKACATHGDTATFSALAAYYSLVDRVKEAVDALKILQDEASRLWRKRPYAGVERSPEFYEPLVWAGGSAALKRFVFAAWRVLAGLLRPSKSLESLVVERADGEPVGFASGNRSDHPSRRYSGSR